LIWDFKYFISFFLSSSLFVCLLKDDVDYIIQNVALKENKAQMIVFSATIPLWLKKSVSRYMSSGKKSFINLIEESQEKTAMNVQHFSMKLNNQRKRAQIILELLQKYSDQNQSQVIVFCQTKHECDLLAQSDEMNSISSDVLHGNLSQRKREQVLTVTSPYFLFSSFFSNLFIL
jgi:superfamily II DNA/RNA helicase